MDQSSRSKFSGKLGYVLAVAGSAVGLGNIWRFPYLAAKYGGGIFLLVYIVLTVSFGYALIMSESALGRMTRKSPIAAYQSFGKSKLRVGGWINAIVPMLIVPYYCVVGGWVVKYLVEFVQGHQNALATDTFFPAFSAAAGEPLIWFAIFVVATAAVVFLGVEKGIERVSKILMPALVVLAVVISVYSVTRPGAWEGVKYYLIPDFSKFSIMTIVAATGQMFYSLSIAMGILVTYGSYMRKDVDMESSVTQIEIMDTLIAFLAGLMIVPSVFVFSGGNEQMLQSGPSLMFVMLPKVFNSMPFGNVVGIVFFLLVLFAALTSSISLMETCVSTLFDQSHGKLRRPLATLLVIGEVLLIGIPCSLGFGVWDFIKPLNMDIFSFFDFISNSVMMPIAALFTCFFIIKVVGFDRIAGEVKLSSKFRREGMYRFCLKWVVPIGLSVILVSSVLSAFGVITI